MHLKILAVMAGGLLGSIAGATTDPEPTMPGEVTLASGRVLRNVSVIRWETDRVVLKHAAGADPVAFALFKTPAPSELPAIKAASLEAKKKEEANQKATAREGRGKTKYAGRMVLTVEGAEVKVPAGTRIYINEPYAGKTITVGVNDPLPGIWVVTDATGAFSFEHPTGQPFVLGAMFVRSLGGGKGREGYKWLIHSDKIKDPKAVLLTEANANKSTHPSN